MPDAATDARACQRHVARCSNVGTMVDGWLAVYEQPAAGRIPGLGAGAAERRAAR
ncbi:MAG: hypothetical protein HYU88_05840 [Chloroflexi bacterium]|nr:hypothetical protein [Chloroflexota bacterium]